MYVIQSHTPNRSPNDVRLAHDLPHKKAELVAQGVECFPHDHRVHANGVEACGLGFAGEVALYFAVFAADFFWAVSALIIRRSRPTASTSGGVSNDSGQ